MKHSYLWATSLFTLAISLASPALAENKSHSMDDSDHGKMKMEIIKHGDLEIMAPMIRASLPSQPVSAGYMLIKNTGKEADHLIGGFADFAAKTEIHEMTIENDIMKMRQLADGIEIPAGGEVVLKKGGHHIMFMKLNKQMVEGESHKVKLIFEKAGPIELELPIKKVEMMDHRSHKK